MTGVVTGSLLGEEAEVVAKATRRRFTAAYKRRILQEADRCSKPGAIGALLRREGLYSSQAQPVPAAPDYQAVGIPTPIASLGAPAKRSASIQSRADAR